MSIIKLKNKVKQVYILRLADGTKMAQRLRNLCNSYTRNTWHKAEIHKLNSSESKTMVIDKMIQDVDNANVRLGNKSKNPAADK